MRFAGQKPRENCAYSRSVNLFVAAAAAPSLFAVQYSKQQFCVSEFTTIENKNHFGNSTKSATSKMGLLTSPTGEEGNKFIGLLEKHGSKLGILSYVIGIGWLLLLANVDYNLKTYFSENALLPGLVVEHFGGGHRAEFYLKELQKQDATEEKVTPEFIYSLLKNVGLAEVEFQNFTLMDPVTKRPEDSVHGKNVFAIHRAKRAAGTEALVFNTPFFSKHGPSRRNFAGIALMLALAEYFQNQVYWAKDIVFLVAEGHPGSLAWVKGHQEMYDPFDSLKYESVRPKAGNIQAAINVIMESESICSLETRFHGINGQLPNLDFVNLLNKFIVPDYEKMADWEKDIWKLISYMKIQATGTTTGSHGFFLKYGIESVTLVGRSPKTCKSRNSFSFGDMGRILEAVFRSLNNLLERLHQSFFFYLKTTPNRFISISLYYPPLALILFPILLKGACVWLTKKDLEITQALFNIIAVQSLAIFSRWSLSNLDFITKLDSMKNFEITAEVFLNAVLALTAFQYMFSFLLLRKVKEAVADTIYCFSLMAFSTSLYSLALFNPSLVILVGVVISPVLTMLFVFNPKKRIWLWGLLTAFFVGLTVDFYSNMETPVNKYFYESEVYGNFLFDFISLLVVPIVSMVSAIV